MDESLFRSFLHDQQAVLAEAEALFNVMEAGITELLGSAGQRTRAALLAQDRLLQIRFDDTTRRLADAYVAGDDGQRADIRQLVHAMPGVNACMGIPTEQIRARIDGARFRLALIFESIKDLRPDADAAVARLDGLCGAAKAAGIDPRPHLREIAEVSSAIRHSGKSSMRELLLAWSIDMVPRSIGAVGDMEPTDRDVPMITYLPTRQLVGYFWLLAASMLLAMMVLAQISSTLQIDGYHATRGAWSSKAVILVLFGIVFYFRSSFGAAARLARTTPPLGVTWTQAVLLSASVFGTLAALVVFMIFFATSLGW
jgi:hypothetical protein